MSDVGVGNICPICSPAPTEEQMDFATVYCRRHRPSRDGDKDREARKLFWGSPLTTSVEEGDGQTGRAYAKLFNRTGTKEEEALE